MSEIVHKPGEGGLFAQAALCGTDPEMTGALKMHLWDYDCAVCAMLAGESA